MTPTPFAGSAARAHAESYAADIGGEVVAPDDILECDWVPGGAEPAPGDRSLAYEVWRLEGIAVEWVVVRPLGDRAERIAAREAAHRAYWGA